MFWVLNEQRQAVAWVVCLQQTRLTPKWLWNTEPGCYDTTASDLHQLSAVAQINVQLGLISRPNIMAWMIYHIQQCQMDNSNQHIEYGDMLLSDDGDDE
jgi:hypothetical protein